MYSLKNQTDISIETHIYFRFRQHLTGSHLIICFQPTELKSIELNPEGTIFFLPWHSVHLSHALSFDLLILQYSRIVSHRERIPKNAEFRFSVFLLNYDVNILIVWSN